MDANQRKKFSRTVLQYLQDPEKANVLRKLLLETDTQNTGSFPEAKQTLRDKIGTFWGSTPIWAVIGMIVGIVASQLSLKLLFIAAWGITFSEFIRAGLCGKGAAKILGNGLAGVVLVLFFYAAWKVTPKPKEPPTLDQELNAFAGRFPWLTAGPKSPESPKLPPPESKKPSLVYIAPAAWSENGAWDFFIRHFGPDPVNNIEMVFSDQYKIKDAQAHNRSLGIIDLYQTFHFQEIDPDEGFWAKQFLWSPINPDDEDYNVVVVSREGRFSEHLKIIGNNRKDWQIAIKVVSQQSGGAVIQCRDSKFPVSSEFPQKLPKCFPEFTIENKIGTSPRQ